MIKQLLLATLLSVSTTVFAAERIALIWGFSNGSNQANFYRAMVADLNRNQNKYEFVFENKPGAGGAIAAKYVLEHPKNTLLGGTSTFFIRPNFDKETGYAAESFQPVLVQTLGAPVAFFSSKYNSINSLNKNQDITTSISGYGSHSNLMGSILGEHYTGVRIINYPNLFDATKDVQGRHIDTGWNWISDIEGMIATNPTNMPVLYVLGITGTRNIKGFPTLASQGINGFENASTNTVIVASAEMPAEKVRELYELLRVANRAPDVQAGYAREYSESADFTWAQTVAWFNQQVKFWRDQSAKVKPLQ